MDNFPSIDEISRKTKFSKFSDKIGLYFRGHNLEDFKLKLNLRENLVQNKHIISKQIAMNKKMEKLDKLSENIKSTLLFREISNSQPNIMELINKDNDDNVKEFDENYQDRTKTLANRKINKSKIIHSLLFKSPKKDEEEQQILITHLGKKKSSVKAYKPKDTISLKKTFSIVKSFVSLSPTNSKKKEEKKIVFDSPSPGKYNPNYTLIHKKVPALCIIEKESNNKHKSFIDKVREIENEKITNLKHKLDEKESKRIEKVKNKSAISINYGKSANFNYLGPKIKGVDFNKYLNRKEFVPSISVDHQTSIEQPPSPSKKESKIVNYDKMTNRQIRIKRSHYHFLSPEVGYYNPNFESILTNHNTITPFSNAKQNKFPLQKLLSKYDVQLEFKSIKLSENNA